MRQHYSIIVLVLLFSVVFVQTLELSSFARENRNIKEELISAKKENKALLKEKKKMESKMNTTSSYILELESKLDIKQNSFWEGTSFHMNLPKEKTAYLTFDDGPSKNTEEILNILKKHKIKATFFVTGNETEFGKKMYKRIVKEGHTIALHSYTHRYDQIYKSVESFDQDSNKLSKLIQDTTGVKPYIMRFPGGSNNSIASQYGGKEIMTKIAAKKIKDGYVYIDWNVDSKDASKLKQDKNVIINEVLAQSKVKKSVNILFHDAAAKTTTKEALPSVIEGLKKQGFIFDSIDQKSYTIQFQRPK